MRLTATAAAFMLVLLPAAAFAQCSWDHKNQSVNQCPEGHAYDVTTGACVKQTTS